MKADCLIPKPIAPPDVLQSMDDERYSRFLMHVCDGSTARRIIISFPFSCNDPLRWFSTNRDQNSFQYYWEKPEKSFVIAALGESQEFATTGKKRFQNMRRLLESTGEKIAHLNGSGDEQFDVHFLGGFSFFDEIDHASWDGFQPGSLILPRYLFIKKGKNCTASIAFSIHGDEDIEALHTKIEDELAGFPKEIADKFSSYKTESSNDFSVSDFVGMPFNHWKKMVTGAKQEITYNKFEKIVLGRQLQLDLPSSSDAVAAINRLRKQFPECYSFIIKHPDSGTFVGSTPELLLSVEENCVRTEALAGSIGRGANEAEDERLEAKLLDSLKDHEEHRFVVRDVKKSLTPFVEDLQIAEQPKVKKLSNVQHLYTPIEGHLKQHSSPLSLLKKLHPTPAVGGTPRDQALEYIRQHEPFNRGWFAGPVGWVTLHDDAQFAVAIRSGLLSQNSALLFAGCGIVADSDPEMEWQETNIKFNPMLSALNYD